MDPVIADGLLALQLGLVAVFVGVSTVVEIKELIIDLNFPLFAGLEYLPLTFLAISHQIKLVNHHDLIRELDIQESLSNEHEFFDVMHAEVVHCLA